MIKWRFKIRNCFSNISSQQSCSNHNIKALKTQKWWNGGWNTNFEKHSVVKGSSTNTDSFPRSKVIERGLGKCGRAPANAEINTLTLQECEGPHDSSLRKWLQASRTQRVGTNNTYNKNKQILNLRLDPRKSFRIPYIQILNANWLY